MHFGMLQTQPLLSGLYVHMLFIHKFMFTVQCSALFPPCLRCISQPAVPVGDDLLSCSLRCLSLCLMEIVLGATKWTFPPRSPKGGTFPGWRSTACSY